jgi:hypothetical protein
MGLVNLMWPLLRIGMKNNINIINLMWPFFLIGA